MDYQAIIDKYYPVTNTRDTSSANLRHILITHSRKVADKALAIVDRHPELGADRQFVEEAAMLHDIGIVRCDADGIQCFGTEPYICHGTIGAAMLRAEGYERHARVCERHTGTGLTADEIRRRQLPLEPRDLMPQTIEEQIICYADKYFSKTRPEVEKDTDRVLRSLQKFGDEGIKRFLKWKEMFD